MAVEIKEEDGGSFLEIRISGRLVKEDYGKFVPEVERLIKANGKVRILLDMHDFHGWSAGALWADIQFDLHHFKDIERVAMIGEKAWQKGMSAFCAPFTTAAIRCFARSDADKARAWVREA